MTTPTDKSRASKRPPARTRAPSTPPVEQRPGDLDVPATRAEQWRGKRKPRAPVEVPAHSGTIAAPSDRRSIPHATPAAPTVQARGYERMVAYRRRISDDVVVDLDGAQLAALAQGAPIVSDTALVRQARDGLPAVLPARAADDDASLTMLDVEDEETDDPSYGNADRAAPAAPPGLVFRADGRLATVRRARSASLLDRKVQVVWLEVYEQTGSKRYACDAVGVASAEYAMKVDPEFNRAADIVYDRFRESILTVATQRAVHGVRTAIIGGKERNEVVGYKTEYSDTLMVALLKKHFPDMRAATERGGGGTQVSVQVNNMSVGPGVGPHLPGSFDLRDARNLSPEQRAALRILVGGKPPAGYAGLSVIDAIESGQDPATVVVDPEVLAIEDEARAELLRDLEASETDELAEDRAEAEALKREDAARFAAARVVADETNV